MKKILAWLLCTGLMLSLLSACGGDTATSSAASSPEETAVSESAPAPTEAAAPQEATLDSAEPEDSAPINQEPAQQDESTTLNFFPVDGESISWWFSYVDDITPDDSQFFQQMQERTGVTIEWQCPNRQTATENFNLMIASGDWTDMVTGLGGMYTTGLNGALEEGIIQDLTEVIQESMPAYQNVLASNKEYTVDTKLDDGRIAAIYGLQAEGYPASVGMAIRKDWLDDLGMDLPRTYDEYHDVLTAFKSEKGATSPLLISASGTENNNFWFTGNGVAGTLDQTRGLYPFYQMDGKVHFSVTEQGFRDTIEMLSQWYEEGLIYKDFMSGDMMTSMNMAMTGETGLYTTFLTTLSNPDSATGGQAWPALMPLKQEGDEIHFGLDHSLVEGVSAGTCITATAADTELCARWLDYLYTADGQLLANYGVEGVSFEYVDGKPQLMDIVLNNPTYGTNIALNYYALNIAIGLLDWSRTTVTYTDAQNAALEIWSEGDNAYNYPTNVTMTVQESEEFNRTYSDISTNVSENVLAFITGSRPLTDESWNEFVSGIEGMGIEKCVEIKQAALDRYLSR